MEDLWSFTPQCGSERRWWSRWRWWSAEDVWLHQVPAGPLELYAQCPPEGHDRGFLPTHQGPYRKCDSEHHKLFLSVCFWHVHISVVLDRSTSQKPHRITVNMLLVPRDFFLHCQSFSFYLHEHLNLSQINPRTLPPQWTAFVPSGPCKR